MCSFCGGRESVPCPRCGPKQPPKVLAKFIGGSLGGTEKWIDYREAIPTYEVPVLATWSTPISSLEFSAPPVPAYVKDTYRLEYKDRNRRIFTYRWVRPDYERQAELLRQEKNQLQARNANLNEELAELEEFKIALKSLRGLLAPTST